MHALRLIRCLAVVAIVSSAFAIAARADAELETLKVVLRGQVEAQFSGRKEPLVPPEYGVKQLSFSFAGDPRSYPFTPSGTLHFSDWTFDIFSTEGTYVLLPQDHYGPYHVVRVDHLKDYLLGRRQADEVVAQSLETGSPARVHAKPSWLSDTELRYQTTCCGETVEHRHSIRFLDYRPKRSSDTLLDYRPALSLDTAGLPAVAMDQIAELVARMDALTAAARGAPGVFEPGDTALGANPQEYVPTDAELRAAQLGDALADLLTQQGSKKANAAWDTMGNRKRSLVYNRFIFRHVDVMGSGRFFYASPPIPTVIEIGSKP